MQRPGTRTRRRPEECGEKELKEEPITIEGRTDKEGGGKIAVTHA